MKKILLIITLSLFASSNLFAESFKIQKFNFWLSENGYHQYLTLVFTGQTIKYGNYTCLPKSAVNSMVNEPATWSSFSGALAKTKIVII